ncbi:multivesicular body subunit 12Bb isoform X1 [Gadus chalcogrammus]|uniref:multivesicular body subunit 12Bb isoform X1 n=1 Tax=Gadus chalcogrammus TaxID=1042646 RepID=UPI0024C3B8ED|nr:multivesicular body subunit 12Bb isoform X1 [Gadus chalcogrammus]
MSDTLDPSRSPDLPEPIGSVGVVASLHKVPDGYQVVAQTTDGGDADLWKDGLFKSKVTRYLCFTRKNQDSVVVDMKFIDLRDAMPMGFTPVLETLDTKEPALRKRRLCVKICPRASAQTVLYDIQVMGRSKLSRSHYTCIGELNNMSIWYSAGDLPPTQRGLPSVANKTKTSTASPATSAATRPHFEHQASGSYALSAMDGVPFTISERFNDAPKETQRVSLMGITIKSLAEVEEEFQYNFSTERSIAL